MIRLDGIYGRNGDVERFAGLDIAKFLWEMLAERDSIANISHRQMPHMVDHVEFIAGRPYFNWWIILLEHGFGFDPVGHCYITKQFEIGIQIAKAYQRRGYARATLQELLEMSASQGQRLLANIAPGNAASIALFAEFDFQLIQHTYERMPHARFTPESSQGTPVE